MPIFEVTLIKTYDFEYVVTVEACDEATAEDLAKWPEDEGGENTGSSVRVDGVEEISNTCPVNGGSDV